MVEWANKTKTGMIFFPTKKDPLTSSLLEVVLLLEPAMVLEMVLGVMYVFTVLSVLAFRGGGGELISMTLNLTS